MKVRSKNELSRFLDEELSWRKRELTTLRFMLDRCRQHEQAVLLRSAICVLYAHWEGYIKFAAITYVSYVAHLGLDHRLLAHNFVALALRSEIQNAGRSSKSTLHTELIAKVISGSSKLLNRGWQEFVDTHYSNLDFDTLEEISCMVGINAYAYSSKRQLLDQRLLQNRNRVAHGKRIDIDPDDYFTLHDEVLKLLQRFRNDLENAAVTDSFRR